MKRIVKSSSAAAYSNWLISEGIIEPLPDHKHPHRRHPERAGIREMLDRMTIEIGKGYHLILEEISRLSDAPQKLKNFRISPEIAKQLQNPKKALLLWEEHIVMQGILGFSSEIMGEMFDVAQNLMHEKRFEDAIRVLVYLVYLNPYVSWFWHSLAQCWQETFQYGYANYAYSVAINCKPGNLEFYRDAVNSLIQIKEYDAAINLLRFGVDCTNQEVSEKLRAIEAYVLSLKAA